MTWPIASASEDVRTTARAADLETVASAPQGSSDVHVGRVLAVDDDTMLLSVLPGADVTGVDTEAAFWSDGTGFASVLAPLIRGQFI